ncbi:MAG TPA: sulfotransferase [Segeticoccus sp.]|uniref:sulfotransferase family protein n=1 Tax=Segeticoccus sp. TaxID=2706531 RepID=UPI002D80B60E|nr:sulfotransferase [Segeticoccus sp.]HET8600140.1 sulfotransferase [Segeticoccus sp.]
MLTFIIGTGRCGSTLLTELVARHPDVGFVSNLDDKLPRLDLKGRWNKTLFTHSEPRDPSLRAFRNRRHPLELARLRIAPSEGWELLERQVSSILPRPCRDLTDVDATPWLVQRLRSFFLERQQVQGTSVFMHHVTGWPRVGLLRKAFPDARFVHVVRDGRAVANSWLQVGWWDGYAGPANWYLGPLPERERAVWDESRRDFVVLAGLGWQLLLDAFDTARSQVPPGQWMDLRFEELIAAPRANISRLLGFLDLDWTAAFEAGFARHTFERGRGTAWQRDLGPAAIHRLEEAIGDSLTRHGYPLSHDAVKPGRPNSSAMNPAGYQVGSLTSTALAGPAPQVR